MLRLGRSGQDVVFLRLLLARYYKEDLGSSSSFDGKLETLVKQYQNQHGLVVDGMVGAKTLASLQQALEAQARPSLRGDLDLGDS